MTRRSRIAVVATVAVLGAVSVAVAALAPGRKPVPIPDLEFQGVFQRALWGGNISVTLDPSGTRIARVQGILPANCRDRRTGRLLRNGVDGAIGIVFDLAGGEIADDGSFSITSRNGSLDGGLAPGTLTMTGAFYGNNALGRLRGTTGRSFTYSSCTGNQPFWIRRAEGS